MSIKIGPRPEDFIWAGGIEDTFIPQTRPGHRALDEYQLMGHYDNWREDLAHAREVGLKALRWGVPWYRVQPAPEEFDWRWIDEVLPYMVDELGITPIIDLMHYGCPFWLRREFASEDYPRAVANYAAAFADRYKKLIRFYTPLNEPIVNALMCGKRGLWPPYLRGEGGYIRIMLQLAKGILKTVQAIKRIDPNSIMVHVEATGMSRAAREDLQVLATEEQRRGYICYDLLTGRVDSDHPLFTWLVRNHASIDDLTSIRRQAIKLDVIGLNFYPQWSTQEIHLDRKGRIAYRAIDPEGTGFSNLIEDYYTRYQAPVIITETSAYGKDEARAQWMKASIAAAKNLRAKGVPLVGYTWFPIFTMVDWRYRFGRGPMQDYLIELGLFKLTGEGGASRWRATPLVEQLRGYINNPVEAIGPLAMTVEH